MRTILGICFGVAVCLGAAATDASAQRPRSINERQVRQQTRIYNGVSNGSLNKKEYGRLQQQQNRIDNREQRYRNSGDAFTIRERARIQHSQSRASRNIYRQKHDRQGYPIP